MNQPSKKLQALTVRKRADGYRNFGTRLRQASEQLPIDQRENLMRTALLCELAAVVLTTTPKQEKPIFELVRGERVLAKVSMGEIAGDDLMTLIRSGYVFRFGKIEI